jgi:two-component system, OmpR family, phosphate regulon sensor histidine kinase PhoR
LRLSPVPGDDLFVSDAATDAAMGPGPAAGRILELLPDPVLVLQGEAGVHDIAYANQAARELFRIREAGGPLGAALRQPSVLEAADAAQASGEVHEVAFETIGVQPRYWRAIVRPLESELLVVLRDETDARRTERMRADFLANASHELRTPLASLAGFVETLRTHARDDPEARDRFLGIMAEQAGRMARLVDDLLSLSRVELNEHIPPDGVVDLAQLVRDVADASRPLSAGRQVAIAIDAPAPARVIGDRDQLLQVVQNLIDNGVKYSPRGGSVDVLIEIAATLDAARAPSREGVALSLLSPDAVEPLGYVALRIADRGPGIARQHLPRLSERFYRVEGQRSGGTGLGLAIVKHIVNRHRGGLVVESAEGEGTTFSVYLPAAP